MMKYITPILLFLASTFLLIFTIIKKQGLLGYGLFFITFILAVIVTKYNQQKKDEKNSL